MVAIFDLMEQSGVAFGTSGARGLADAMTDEVCYAYTTAFIQHLEQSGELQGNGIIAVGGDLRPSTGRIVNAVCRAIADGGHLPLDCGRLPTPALAYYGRHGREHPIPTVMVTGSHIPADRNGIKFTKAAGEILKLDEASIRAQQVDLPPIFDAGGLLTSVTTTETSDEARRHYIARYLEFFPRGCLEGRRIGVFGHSAVGRDQVVEILEALGARVERLGWSDTFVAVDTEAIRAEDIEAARHWSAAFRLDAIVSTDGDSDRPLVADEKGKWLRGDVAGVLASTYLGADGIATPVSCNSLIERCGRFARVVRTRIGSPFVIEAMAELADMGYRCVVGFEANGGLLLGSDIERQGRTLRALPTRDAIIVHLAVMLNAFSRDASISDTVMELPARYTHSIRLQSFPVAKSQAKIEELSSGDDLCDRAAIDALLADHLGPASALDRTDGLRITLASGEVVHFRPSGNAPELRCYTEADSEARAVDLAAICKQIMESWR